MLTLVSIFLATLLVSTVSVWCYRTFAGWHNFNGALVGRKPRVGDMTLKPQKGYVKLGGLETQPARRMELRSPKGGIKKPWGW